MFASDRLVLLRAERGLSRSALHRALVRRGCERCRALINRWEAGTSEPSANDVELLAEVLGVSVDELFTSAGGR